MKRLLFIFALFSVMIPMGAQETLMLEDCLRIGIENNLSLKTSRNEVLKGKHTLSENHAKLLPQINAVASFNDNFEPPVSVTDGSAYGKLYNVTKTLQYNAAAGLQLQMPLYNQTVYTSIEIARTLNQLNELSYEKAKEDLVMQISKMYFLAQNTVEQLNLVRDNIARLKELRDITVAFYDNEMAVEVDVQRVNINLENLQVQYDNAKAMLTQQYNMLKYVMDYPAERDIAVVETNAEEVTTATFNGLNTNQYELLLLQEKSRLAEQQKKIVGHGYLPTLSLTGSWMYSAYTDKFKNWFHSGPSNHWYDSYGLGLSLRVPVFDGFDKRSRIRKAKIDVENARLSYTNALKNMETQYLNAINELQNSERNYRKQRDNCRLAENVCKVTNDRYREGISSMTEVLQDEMRVSEAQNNYLTAHYNYQIANLTLLKLTKQLDKLIKQ
ncbi:MAG: TolC family protein [Prevotella sp.]|nr:TolC family protein [Prevotella sp.]MCI5855043.1 TolC family protein [Prevotella sp.]MDD6737301.1 TolC family protein [Prevotella sp.]MDY6091750.1 TolC family protein [Prevotella sp.]